MDKNKGTKYRWPTILSIEIVKTLIQIKMFFNAGGSILCHRHFPSRPSLFEPSQENDDIDHEDEDPLEEDLHFEDIFSHINNKTGKRWTLAEAQLIHKEIEKRKRETSSIPTQTTISVAFGELIWIFRPLIYLYALFKHGPKSWRPWIYSLLVDIGSWRLQSGSASSFNSLELEELGRRRFLWVLYLVRAPGPLKIFFKWLTTSSLTKVPGIETAASFIVNILQIIQQRYFYTAGSS
jgi:peroxin-16